MTNATNTLIPPHGGYEKLLSYKSATVVYDFTVEFCKTYMTNPENAANCAICLINQTNYLLDRQLAALDKEFLEKGGFTERLYNARREQHIRSGDLSTSHSFC